MNGCKIGKVKLKNGAEVLRFPAPARDEVQQDLMDWAAGFARWYSPGEMHGFILIAWDKDSSRSVAYLAKSSFVHSSNAPSFAAEEVRRALVRQGAY